MKRHLRLAGCLVSLIGLVPFIGSAQPIPAGQLAPAGRGSATLTDQQLDQLTAPIALYSDPLVGQILMAATYPLEVVEAQRWLQDPVNAAVTGTDLVTALQQESWDPSVKSLVPFPQILAAMNDDIEWTEQIGDAFLAQQGAVMDSIQRLRQRAAAEGTLKSTPQQMVSTDDQDIAIEPADPVTVYVPYYDPTVVFGPWPWSEYPPSYFPPPADVVIADGALIGFGAGCSVVGPLWGWNHWDWGHHRLDIVSVRPNGAPVRAGPWEHDPAHRRGVPYRNAVLAGRYQRESDASRRDFRGFSGLSATTRAPEVAQRGTEFAPRASPTRIAPSSSRNAAPAYESFDEGARARGQAARGAASRSTSSSGSHGGEPPRH